MRERIRQLIFDAIDGTITASDFDELQAILENNAAVREEYLAAVAMSENLVEITRSSHPYHEDGSEQTQSDEPVRSAKGSARTLNSGTGSNRTEARLFPAIVATIIAVACVAFWFGRWNSQSSETSSVALLLEPDSMESGIAGHATLRRSVDVRWQNEAEAYREGDVLPRGSLTIEEGLAEIDFFCGATLIVEGPATLQIESDWSVQVEKGRLLAHVPPAARGFIVKAADSEIIDLGTKFALEVVNESARVHVIDGEVELRGKYFDGRRLTTGQGQWLNKPGTSSETIKGLSTFSELGQRRDHVLATAFEQWQQHSEELRKDARLIAYYPIAEKQNQRTVPNVASADSSGDGLIVGSVEKTAGRFGAVSTGLDFGRPGARVRTRIEGEFEAFTFICWARIDNLEHRYNALFMGDGYDNGEPHWQIRDDGRLMFSVMVDDSKPTRRFDKTEKKFVTTAGLHHVYYTDPIWDITQSGQWFQLAAVYDPASRQVKQFVNGRLVSSEEIKDKYLTTTLRIGSAELGNWGQPFRDSPWFAVRNLNGTIDELAIFNTALSELEINAVYNSGKPPGH